MKKKYTKTNWVDGKTCVGANLLNKIESGIEGLYQNAVEVSQLIGGEDIKIQKNEDDNLVVSVKENNSLLRSTGISEVEFGEELPNEIKSTGLYLIRNSHTGKFSIYYGNLLVFSSIPDTASPDILGGYIKIDEPDENGRVRIDYLDENNDIEVEMGAKVNGESVDILEDEDGNFYIQLEDSIESEVEVIISADGYEDLRKTETFTWIAPEEESSVFEGTVELSLIDGFTDQFEVVYTGTDASEVTFGFSDNPEDPFYEVLSGNTIKKLRPGVFTLVISIFAEGFEQKDVTINLDWRDLAETPEISFEEERNDRNEVVSVEVRIANYTSYTITQDGDEVIEGLFTFDANYEEDQSIIVRATNNPDETTYISKEVEEYYSLRKLAKISSQPGEITTTMTATSVNVEVSGKDADTEITLLDSEENTLENPFSIPRPGVEEEDSIFQLTITTLDLGEEYEETEILEEIEVPHQVYSSPATSNITEGDEAYTIDFIGSVTKVYLDGDQVETPYVVTRQDEDQELIFTVYTEEEAKLETETEITVTVPRVLITETPVINTEEVDETVIVTATGEGTVTLSIVGGEIVDNPYTIEKTEQSQTINFMATAKADGKRISEVATLTVEIPALVYAPQPTFNWDNQTYTMNAVCENHEVILKLEGEEINNPYTVEQTENEQTLVFTAYTLAGDGEDRNSAEIESEEIVIPSQSVPIEPVVKDLEGQILYTEPTEEGIVTFYYSGEENVILTVILNGEGQVGTTIQLQEGENTIGVTANLVGYRQLIENFTIAWAPESTISELEGEITFNGPDENGIVTVDYSGGEEVTFEITLNGQEYIGTSIQLQEGENIIEVTVSAEGYTSTDSSHEYTWPTENLDPEPNEEP